MISTLLSKILKLRNEKFGSLGKGLLHLEYNYYI